MDNAEMYRMIVQAITESNDELKTQLTEQIDGVRSDLTATIDGVRADLTATIDDLRTEMTTKFEEVYNRFDKLDEDMDYLKTKFHEHDKEIFLLKKKRI
jgi:flagellar capping protein FliD